MKFVFLILVITLAAAADNEVPTQFNSVSANQGVLDKIHVVIEDALNRLDLYMQRQIELKNLDYLDSDPETTWVEFFNTKLNQNMKVKVQDAVDILYQEL